MEEQCVRQCLFRFRLPKLTQIMVTSCYFSSAVLKTEYRVLVFLLWSSGEKKPILHFLCSHPITFSFRKAQWLKLTKRRSLQENQHMGNWKYFCLLAADRCWHRGLSMAVTSNVIKPNAGPHPTASKGIFDAASNSSTNSAYSAFVW